MHGLYSVQYQIQFIGFTASVNLFGHKYQV